MLSLLLIVASTVSHWMAPTQGPALERFTVTSDGHPMAVWARRPVMPTAAVLLVHGRTWSSRPDFDLQVPGLERSVMRSLATRGVAAYAVDLRGYGDTPRDRTGWMTPGRSARDIHAVLVWMRSRHPDLAAPAVVGWSRGAAIAMLAAQAAPEHLSALVMFGFAYDPEGHFADPAELPRMPLRLKNTSAAAASDFISPQVTPPAVLEAFVEQALRTDPVMADLRQDSDFNRLDPRRVTMPTLVIFGERDPAFVREDAGRMLAALATREKRLVVLPGADHAAQIEDTHDEWVSAVVSFVSGRTTSSGVQRAVPPSSSAK